MTNLKIKLLTLTDRTSPESSANPLHLREVEIDPSQIVQGVWGSDYTTIHSWTTVDGEQVAIRAVVKHVQNQPNVISEIEITSVYWQIVSEMSPSSLIRLEQVN